MGENSDIFQMACRGDWPHRNPLRRRAVLPSVQVRPEVPLRVSGSDVCRRQSAHPPPYLLKRTHLPVNPHRRLESGAISRDCLLVNHINAVFSQRKGKGLISLNYIKQLRLKDHLGLSHGFLMEMLCRHEYGWHAVI